VIVLFPTVEEFAGLVPDDLSVIVPDQSDPEWHRINGRRSGGDIMFYGFLIVIVPKGPRPLRRVR
jgi:hypothetical protein